MRLFSKQKMMLYCEQKVCSHYLLKMCFLSKEKPVCKAGPQRGKTAPIVCRTPMMLKPTILTQKLLTTKLLELWSGIFIPDPGSRFFPYHIPDPEVKKEWIPNPRYESVTLQQNINARIIVTEGRRLRKLTIRGVDYSPHQWCTESVTLHSWWFLRIYDMAWTTPSIFDMESFLKIIQQATPSINNMQSRRLSVSMMRGVTPCINNSGGSWLWIMNISANSKPNS